VAPGQGWSDRSFVSSHGHIVYLYRMRCKGASSLFRTSLSCHAVARTLAKPKRSFICRSLLSLLNVVEIKGTVQRCLQIYRYCQISGSCCQDISSIWCSNCWEFFLGCVLHLPSTSFPCLHVELRATWQLAVCSSGCRVWCSCPMKHNTI